MEIKDYLNFEFIHASELPNKTIKAISEENYQQYILVLTTDNELSGYKLDVLGGDPWDDYDNGSVVLVPLEYEDILSYIESDPYRYFLTSNNLVTSVDELYKAIELAEQIELRKHREQEKAERYQLYQKLKKEFDKSNQTKEDVTYE